MLASTADRERALDVLKDGFVEGRLTKEEYDTRVGSTYVARTYADLAEVTADLPGGQSVIAHPPAPPAFPAHPPPDAVYPQYPYPPHSYPPYRYPPYPPYRYPPVYRPRPKPNSLAAGSAWFGVSGLFLGVTSIPAVIMGIVAIRQIRRTGESGLGLATAGLALGVLGVILFVLRIVSGGFYS
jgi:hypothetical protein